MMTRIRTIGILAAGTCILGVRGPAAAEPAGTWRAGVARADTTPTIPVRMAGYASRTSPSQGVAHPLAAKALVLTDRAGKKVVLVTCDIIAFRRAFTNRVVDRVKARHGIDREDIVLFASHTHTGPSLVEPAEGTPRVGADNNARYTQELEDKLVLLVDDAMRTSEPVTLSYGIGRAHFALNRREPTGRGAIKLGKYPAGPTDEGVPILRVQKEDGTPMAIVFGYACHNTTLRPDTMKIAADYAGYAQDRVEAEYPGATALFVTGCAGDADPHPFGTLEMAKDHGDELGAAVKFVLDHPNWLRSVDGPARTSYAETTIRFAGPTDRASYEKMLDDPNQNRRRHARSMIDAIDAGKTIRTEYPNYSAQAIAFGRDLTLVALSGEVVVDYDLRLQREVGGESTPLWVAAYANDVIGYIPSVRVLKEGGYEGGEAFRGSSWPAPLAEDIESIVVGAARKVIEAVRER
jgi:neutral ceramidase